MSPIRRPAFLVLLGLGTWLACAAAARAAELVTRPIVPSSVDPKVKEFDDPSLVVFPKGAPADRPLVVFMPGTKGRPQKAADFLGFIADQGFRVIGLEYDDMPAVQQICPDDPDPGCAAAFRAMRIYGEGDQRGPVANPPAESIVARLTALLASLDTRYPREGWGTYLKDGAPDWSRIVVTGLSQGAGMAAFIAKRSPVARVVLFSSPWDYTGLEMNPAPWLSKPSATPPERWFAAYHRREKTAEAIQHAYAALQIPADHILVFDRDLPTALQTHGPNPFHPSTIRDKGYAPQWAQMFGRPP